MSDARTFTAETPVDTQESRDLAYAELQKLTEPSGVRFTPERLVIIEPDVDKTKVLDSYTDVRASVTGAMREGKHVLILPGTYDLLHAGHVAWFIQAIDTYRKTLAEAGIQVSREDLFVVAPFDSDGLVSVVKARKYVGNGGKEPFRRPVASQDIRATALASLPWVDVVAAIPSPLEIDKAFQAPKEFSVDDAERLLEELNATGHFANPQDYRDLKNGFRVFRSMTGKGFTQVQKAFQAIGMQQEEADRFLQANGVAKDDFAIQAWQLMTHLHKMNADDRPLPKAQMIASRVVSNWDSAYNAQVAYLMGLAGISVTPIWDKVVASTTDILKQYGETPTGIEHLLETVDGNNWRFSRP